ncbi:hypothetical protein AMATHDRAFT_137318 [Amanita thiersii Skay4041]|uniref:T-cell immunomodulatory protein TIP C2 domain-containing protein n=1 Tax=Amanita thiersii Skay4041 TaxID=703135 RepID=A0A2A9NZN0_9AGAR|nr:hypothetical protein AMATHDRAFT_137318 [Amanita thiersii Skay4041]
MYHLPSSLLFLFIPLLFLPPSSAIWPFPPKRFTKNALIAAGSMGLDGNARIVAYGDFNRDQFLDILTLSDDQQTLITYNWDHVNFNFYQSFSIHHPSKVLNVVPGDFRHTGKLDLLVMSPASSRSEIEMTLYPGLASGGFNTVESIHVQSSTQAQPIPIDMDGDLKIDLFGESAILGRGSFQLWQNLWNESQPESPLFDMRNPNFHGSQCTLANPHSNAVVDLDGDCLADVFLVCDDGRGNLSYQIWVNKKDDGFVLSQQGSLPSGTQAISFADIDRDGTIDMVFPTCSRVTSDGVGRDCYINIAFNQQLGLCASTSDSGLRKGVQVCRPPDSLCIPDPHFKFDIGDTDKEGAFVRFPLKSIFPGSTSLLVADTTFQPPLPIPLKLGDANLDGFPDLLAITVNGKERVPNLVFSVPCTAGVVGCGSKTGSGRRGWSVAKKGVEVLQDIKDARSVSFLDIDEDGSLDILVQRTGDTGEGKILFVQNNFYFDAFFLKAIVLNGACNNGWCYGANESERYQPFGVSYSGASYKYTILDTSGHRSAAQVGQLPQTSYHSLQTPYSFFGLGRTNNYIENLFVGTTVHSKEHYINMEGVIPNSRVVILPSSDSSDTWKRELFLRPGEWIPWVTLAVVGSMFLLAIIVLVLHMNEKREDELERRRASHHINFDAL